MSHARLTTLASVLLLAAAIASPAWGQDGSAPFAKGSMTSEYTVGYGVGDDSENIGSVRAGLGYFLWDDVSAVLDVQGAYLDQKQEDATAVGLDLLLRWHALKGEGSSLFLEGGAGILQANRDVPTEHGTHFNFTPQVGVGATYDLGGSMSLIGGARYMHISNANCSGSDHNNGMETFGAYLGIQLPF